MTKVPVVHYEQAIRALKRGGWVVVRQKETLTETLRIIIPAHRPIKRSTFSHILKQAKLSVDQFKALL